MMESGEPRRRGLVRRLSGSFRKSKTEWPSPEEDQRSEMSVDVVDGTPRRRKSLGRRLSGSFKKLVTPRSKSSGELGSPGASPTSDAARDDDSPLASPGTIPALSLPPLPPKAKTVLAQDSEEAFDPQVSTAGVAPLEPSGPAPSHAESQASLASPDTPSKGDTEATPAGAEEADLSPLPDAEEVAPKVESLPVDEDLPVEQEQEPVADNAEVEAAVEEAVEQEQEEAVEQEQEEVAPAPSAPTLAQEVETEPAVAEEEPAEAEAGDIVYEFEQPAAPAAPAVDEAPAAPEEAVQEAPAAPVVEAAAEPEGVTEEATKEAPAVPAVAEASPAAADPAPVAADPAPVAADPAAAEAPSKAVVPRSPNSFFRSFLGVAVAAVAVVAVAALGGALPKRDAKAAAPKK